MRNIKFNQIVDDLIYYNDIAEDINISISKTVDRIYIINIINLQSEVIKLSVLIKPDVHPGNIGLYSIHAINSKGKTACTVVSNECITTELIKLENAYNTPIVSEMDIL